MFHPIDQLQLAGRRCRLRVSLGGRGALEQLERKAPAPNKLIGGEVARRTSLCGALCRAPNGPAARHIFRSKNFPIPVPF